ncbi:MAG TPA: bifunctional methylenetetrahydrofolate dehydrogenase/methenyltetrahydrofolate cyclohydrolase FolD [Myxococcales bacterium]|nr:bifunctional methylenetetrahydrofolate dehydrogenase/methenyltetrahydrofolate cyclohydrolase FolD [Deltaproteobacteria bacterium]MBU52903.1 bifunctional methylenetetrahydrofolate dehydrogenase/methenyltetrahydrofolate cyclohydrolase FolD [Deltaproteobacteria bacterium]HAA59286.1 bifunctional methylenetetrahydrofolate dehydrogenase/methenyltetrahydrofolate cyclohydrolase FolD [Myxococcales bacterium]|tara:strand:+ start:2488 stop:3348 length:861 start_codon:yes stop_codon:yes gene_type:complete
MLIDGKSIAIEIRKGLKQEVATLTEQGIVPGLEVILVGDDPASQVYVRSKERACERAGIRSVVHRLPAETPQEDLHALIQKLNKDDAVDGILLQLPLPKGLDSDQAILQIAPEKDVDGLHPVNLGRLVAGLPGPRPCTPLGCIALLDKIGYNVEGKKAVVIGRSILVGKPIGLLLLQKNATVTYCHSRTQQLEDEVRAADIVVAAVGRPQMVRGSWLKPDAVVIDVGINRLDDGSLVGDVHFEEAEAQAKAITPVPGGVGPMTIAMLLQNTVDSAKIRKWPEHTTT